MNLFILKMKKVFKCQLKIRHKLNYFKINFYEVVQELTKCNAL